jgi:hypothetical protein
LCSYIQRSCFTVVTVIIIFFFFSLCPGYLKWYKTYTSYFLFTIRSFTYNITTWFYFLKNCFFILRANVFYIILHLIRTTYKIYTMWGMLFFMISKIVYRILNALVRLHDICWYFYIHRPCNIYLYRPLITWKI